MGNCTSSSAKEQVAKEAGTEAAPAAPTDPSKPLQTEAWVVPAPKAKLELKTVTLPPLGDDEVQIDMTHCGLCHTDIHMRDNDWGVSNYPLVAGHEGFGVVTFAGSKVTMLKVGDKAGVGWMRDSCGACSQCSVGMENLCESGYQGTFLSDKAGCWGKKPCNEFGCFAKVVRIKEKFAFKFPENLPPEVACPLMCAGATLFEPVKTWVQAGASVGIGSMGGLGTLGVQLAKKQGARVAVFSRGTKKRDAAMKIGAGAFVDTTDAEAMKKAEGSLDVFIDTCPVNNGVDHLMALLKINGTLVRVGIPSGDTHKFETGWIPMIFTAKRIAGSIVCGSSRTNEMVKLVSEDKSFFCESDAWTASAAVPFSEVNSAMDKLLQQDMSTYRIVLKW